jgi:hypothetical protein
MTSRSTPFLVKYSYFNNENIKAVRKPMGRNENSKRKCETKVLD